MFIMEQKAYNVDLIKKINTLSMSYPQVINILWINLCKSKDEIMVI